MRDAAQADAMDMRGLALDQPGWTGTKNQNPCGKTNGLLMMVFPLRKLQNLFEYQTWVQTWLYIFHIYLGKVTKEIILGRYDSNEPGSIGRHVWRASLRNAK